MLLMADVIVEGFHARIVLFDGWREAALKGGVLIECRP